MGDKANIHKQADTAGEKILDFLVGELRLAGVWDTLSDKDRRQFLDTAIHTIRRAVVEGYAEVLSGGGNHSVAAKLGSVTVAGEKVSSKVAFETLDEGSLHRVVDFSERNVMVTLVDSVEQALEGMEDVVDTAQEVQQELHLDEVTGNQQEALDLGEGELEIQESTKEGEAEKQSELWELADPNCGICKGHGHTVEGDKTVRCACTDKRDNPADPDCPHCEGRGYKTTDHGVLECICTVVPDPAPPAPPEEAPNVAEEPPAEEPKAYDAELEKSRKLYEAAREIVVVEGRVSIKGLCVALSITETRSRELIDWLEVEGVVSEPKGNRRQVLWDKNYLVSVQAGEVPSETEAGDYDEGDAAEYENEAGAGEEE